MVDQTGNSKTTAHDLSHWRPATQCAKLKGCQHPYCECPRQEDQPPQTALNRLKQWLGDDVKVALDEIERLRSEVSRLEDELFNARSEASGLRMQLEDQTDD